MSFAVLCPSAIVAFTLLATVSLAQSIDVKDLKASEEGTTTIEIKKGAPKGSAQDPGTSPAQWEVVEGEADIDGDSAPMKKEAKSNWNVACDTWKKELKADNAENKIISLNCGSPNCSGEAGNQICSSKAKYKIKTKLN